MTDLAPWRRRLLVTGQPVTEQQANDILIRTANLWLLHTNDRDRTDIVGPLLGIESGNLGQWAPDSVRAAVGRLRCLDLQWLHTSRIASSWVGGPHGWCDWDGTIGCFNYAIAKWPDVESITQEWRQIAAAFRYLDLTAQLVDDETPGTLAGEWRVRAGRVEFTPDPAESITEPCARPADFFDRFLPHGERGVSLTRLRAAVAQALSVDHDQTTRSTRCARPAPSTPARRADRPSLRAARRTRSNCQ
ncbi:hypothetical protein [Streptomyces sp. NPDC086782]|uniref:hypothetical protein n=1 Tax=Streptomyces sp. NPDC086782 TaxID=3365757 RepID=UPI003825D6FA